MMNRSNGISGLSGMRHHVAGWVACASLLACVMGCVNVKAPEQIQIGDRPGRLDTSHVPPTRNHAEARQRLAEAYERNRYLEAKVDELERKNDQLEDECDRYKDCCEERYE